MTALPMIPRRLPASNGALVISHNSNKGKGAALRTGLEYALQKEFEYVITIDTDGQHNPKFIPDFIAAFQNSGADLIIGSRRKNKMDMPWDRRCSNWMTSGILSLLLRRKIDDSQCGYRLLSRKLLESIKIESERFEVETEIIIKADQNGFDIKFIPIEVNYGVKFPTNIKRIEDTFRWCRRVLELI